MIASYTIHDLLHEPYWWIRLVEAALGVVCFFLFVTYSACGSITINCGTGQVISQPEQVCIKFPFKLSQQTIDDSCHGRGNHVDYFMHVDYDSQAIFLFIIMLMTTLYAIGVLFMYMQFWDKYNKNTFFMIPDLMATCCYAAYWLASTSSFISALIGMKDYTSDDQMAVALEQISACNEHSQCTINKGDWGKFLALDFVCFLGIVNMAVWAVNAFLIMRKIQMTKIAEMSHLDRLANSQQYSQFSSVHFDNPNNNNINNKNPSSQDDYGACQ